MASVYVAHHHHQPDFIEHLTRTLISYPSGTAWVVAGDWNSTYPDSMFCAAMGTSPTNVAQADGPSRWTGRETIDYLVMGGGLEHKSAHYWEHRVSDHKLLDVALPLRVYGTVHYSLQKHCNYPCPSQMDKKTWIGMLEDEWMQRSVPSLGIDDATQQDIDTNRNDLQAHMEATFRQALIRCDGKVPQGVAKGTYKIVQRTAASRNSNNYASPCCVLSMARQIGRLQDFYNRQCHGQPIPAILWRRLTKRFSREQLAEPLHSMRTLWQQILLAEQQAKLRRHEQWRVNMRDDFRKCCTPTSL